jgi:hypothetical protein
MIQACYPEFPGYLGGGVYTRTSCP